MKTLKEKVQSEYNFKTDKFKLSFKEKDVKKAFIDFDTWLFEHRHDSVDYFTIQDIRKQFLKIFGEFTEYKDYKKIINKNLSKENNKK